MRIVFDARARDDIERLFDWIANDNPKAALDMVSRIEARVRLLAAPGFAQMGRPGVVEGTREVVEHPYIVVYEVREREREIVVIAVMHGAQNRDP